jgi:Ribosomal protein L7/L12 dimerisation domain
MADVSKLVDELSSLTVLDAAELARLLKEKWKPPKVSLADIKNDLPLWPDEVIKLWLVYLANRARGDTGWPPPDPLEYHPWAFILGFRPLPWWREVTWKREKTDCSFSNLCQGTKTIVARMLAEKANGTIDEETGTRFKKAADYILKNGGFKEPPIAMRLADGLSILDGNHRISAFCGVQEESAEILEKRGLRKPAQEQELWIGTHSRGEVPLDYPPDT